LINHSKYQDRLDRLHRQSHRYKFFTQLFLIASIVGITANAIYLSDQNLRIVQFLSYRYLLLAKLAVLLVTSLLSFHTIKSIKAFMKLNSTDSLLDDPYFWMILECSAKLVRAPKVSVHHLNDSQLLQFYRQVWNGYWCIQFLKSQEGLLKGHGIFLSGEERSQDLFFEVDEERKKRHLAVPSDYIHPTAPLYKSL